MRLAETQAGTVDAELDFDLDDPVLGLITTVTLRVRVPLEPTLWVYRDLCVQPVYIRWAKCCRTFTVRAPIFVDDAAYKVLSPADGPDAGSSPDEAQDLMDERNVDNCVEVFVAERWDSPVYDGGGATWSSGTASAKIVTVDQQLAVPCSGANSCAACGALNQNHLAHELGHVLNLCHPAECPSADRPRGTATTVMEPSGWCADNPNLQSRHNCVSASNPLVRYVLSRTRCSGSWEINGGLPAVLDTASGQCAAGQ